MSQINSMEQVLDALIDKLRRELPTKIAQINAEIDDEYPLDEPVEILLSVRGEPPGYPYVVVLPETSEPSVDHGVRVLWNHRVRVVSFISDWQEESLARKTLRYQRAVREAIMIGRDPDYGGYGLQHVSDDYGPVFAPNPGEFVQGTASVFQIQQQQDF